MEGNSTMKDSQNDSPSIPLGSNHRRFSSDDAGLEVDDREHEPAENRLPSKGPFYALLVGGLAGLVAVFFHITITFINAPLYNEAARLAVVGKMSLNMAWTITGLGCLNIFLDLALSFAVGYLVGRIAVQRRHGALAGACFGAVTCLASFIVRFLPNYPNKITSHVPPSLGNIFAGILTSIVILLVYTALGALLGVWGAWAATRKHLYYQQREQE